MNKKQLTILVIILTVVAAGAATWAVFTRRPTPVTPPLAENSVVQSISANNGTEPTTPTPEVVAPDLDTSNWKTYQNEQFGFGFLYPEDMTINIEGNDIVLSSEDLELVDNGNKILIGYRIRFAAETIERAENIWSEVFDISKQVNIAKEEFNTAIGLNGILYINENYDGPDFLPDAEMRIKSGDLNKYFIFYVNYTKDNREQVLNIVKSIALSVNS